MDTRELRIGNIIYYNGTNGPTKNLNKIDGEDIKLMSEKFDYLKLHEPIPLTEEWLLKFGFEVDDETGGIGILRTIPEIDFYFELFPRDDHFKWGYKIVKYVHQLQNLYYALTGQELTLKIES